MMKRDLQMPEIQKFFLFINIFLLTVCIGWFEGVLLKVEFDNAEYSQAIVLIKYHYLPPHLPPPYLFFRRPSRR